MTPPHVKLEFTMFIQYLSNTILFLTSQISSGMVSTILEQSFVLQYFARNLPRTESVPINASFVYFE